MNIRFIYIAKIGCGGYQYYFKISFNNQLFQILSFYLVEKKIRLAKLYGYSVKVVRAPCNILMMKKISKSYCSIWFK